MKVLMGERFGVSRLFKYKMSNNLTSLHKDIATLKANDISQGKQINEIHKALMGNGQPGLLAEWNQWKGTVKFSGFGLGVCVCILTLAISALAYLK